jgi:hypothetical protein
MHKGVMAGAAAACCALTGVAVLAANQPMGSMHMMSMKPTVVVMHAENGSGENGTATLTSVSGGTKVVISLKNAKGTQPAHIHPGPCSKLAPAPKYALNNVVNGSSTTIVKAPLSDLLGKHYAINVHESTTNLAKYVSCGNIP